MYKHIHAEFADESAKGIMHCTLYGRIFGASHTLVHFLLHAENP